MSLGVITGASQGIGKALAHAFSSVADMQLVLMSRSRDKLQRVARNTGSVAWPCDVTNEDEVTRAASMVIDRYGAPDVLINNAGRFSPATLSELAPGDFREQLEVNLTSAFLTTRAFLPAMQERKFGHIFFMGSVASKQAYKGAAAYCAAKHGLLGLARAVREETKSNGLRVTTILPGATLTPSWDGTELPESRFIDPSDLAESVVGIWQLSERTVVEEILVRPQLGDI